MSGNAPATWRPPSFADVATQLQRDPKGTGANLDLAIQTLFRQQSAGTHNGATAARPGGVNTGFMYFDTTLGKPIWWSGSTWVDATGASV